MGLFNRKKESKDLEQTSEVKSATAFESSMPTLGSLNQTEQSSNSSLGPNSESNSNFNNPFAVVEQNGQANNSPISSLDNQNMNQQTPQVNQQPSSVEPLNSNMNSNSKNNNLNGQSIAPTNFSALNTPQQTEMFNPNDYTNSKNQSQPSISRDDVQEMVDETVEKVIEERWVKLIEKVEKVAIWKEKQEAHVNMIKEDIVSMKDAFEKLEKRIITKIGDYDRNILDVNSEIKALEKVFQKITPTLVNNVNELSKIANTFREENNSKTFVDDDDTNS